MDAKKPGNTLIAVEPMRGTFEQWAEDTLRLGGTHLAQIGALPPRASTGRPRPDPEASARLARAVHQAMNEGLVESAHDASDGGILCAVAEMLIAGSTPERPLGCRMYPLYRDDYLMAYWFGERSCYVLECKNPVHTMKRIGELYGGALGANILGSPLDASGILDLNDEYGSVPVSDLAAAWLGTLDW
ncbi:MAG: hypothetical protein DYG94_09495 [Leptolyngbya sp. PLA3]|nr:MAG: hypothetical protein EDM82_11835 [Cyanobacteria bacterium CYA]MCE7968962.1 hypothetical protein [Leptolyngbya sp. PL-A3]